MGAGGWGRGPYCPPARPYGAMAPPPLWVLRGQGKAQPRSVPVLVGPQLGPRSSTARVPRLLPPPSQGCTFKTFCIYFAFYYL